MPLSPARAGRPPSVPRFVSDPSFESIRNTPTAPLAAFSEYRYAPSELIAISRFVDPAGFTPTIVLDSGASAPLLLMENPAMDEVPAFDAYTNRPFGVTTFQQFAAPR